VEPPQLDAGVQQQLHQQQQQQQQQRQSRIGWIKGDYIFVAL
jgi:hypothetical protein